ncbi:MAG: MG2 domain-containing protein [Saprospiraceae bacterium]|nr:MG2 domain-containing protein [Saprospiraceae bacterium]
MKHVYSISFLLFLLGNSYSISAQSIQSTLQDIQSAFDTCQQILPNEKLYAHTDRSLYYPGEDIWFKAYIVNSQHKASKKSNKLQAQLISPKGDIIKEVFLNNNQGTANGDFNIPANAAGGLYKLRIVSNWMKNLGEHYVFEKTLTVQKVALPNLLMKLDFEKENYSAGEEVMAFFEVRSKDNQVLANRTLDYTVHLAGKQLCAEVAETDQDGEAAIIFQLPKDLDTDDGLLNIKIQHEGNTEAISRSVPILSKDLALHIMPEGGDMITNVENTVAFKALNKYGKPADVKGVIIASNGDTVQHFDSYHQGMGAFTLKPKKNLNYHAKITSPKNIDLVYNLPQSLDNTLGLRLEEQNKIRLKFTVYSPINQDLLIVGKAQDQLQYTKVFNVKKGKNTVIIPTDDFPMGIAQFTLFDAQKRPHCERLVFMNAHRKLNVEIKPNKDEYLPRDLVKLDIKITDDAGKGVATNFSLAVIDDNLHTFADDKQDDILSGLLLSSELKGDIYEPNFYFDPEKEKAPKALSYLMLTQGWRRFAWRDIFEKTNEDWQNYAIYQAPSMQIEGYAKLNNKALKNTSVYLSTDRYVYSKTNATASTETDDQGYFSFEGIHLNFPVYVGAKNRGIKGSGVIYGYSNVSDNSSPFAKNNTSSASTGNLAGVTTNTENQILSFATIELRQDGRILSLTTSDYQGNFEFKDIAKGTYDLIVEHSFYQPIFINNIEVGKQNTAKIDIALGTDKNPKKYELANAKTERKDKNSPVVTKDISKITATTAGVNQQDEGDAIDFRGSRDAEKDIDIVVDGRRDADDLAFNNKVALEEIVIVSGSKLMTNSAAGKATLNEAVIVQRELHDNDRYALNTDVWLKNAPQSYISLAQTNYKYQANSYYTARQFYAPQYPQAKTQANVNRTDFRKTVYWANNLKTDASGKTSTSFYTSDAVNTFRIILEGIEANGQIARAEQTYFAQLPFSISTKLPKVASFGDTINIPVTLKNTTQKAISGKLLAQLPENFELLDNANTSQELTIEESGFKTVYLPCRVKFENKLKTSLNIQFESQGLSDQLQENIDITPMGFPQTFSMSGATAQQEKEFTISGPIPKSKKATLKIYTDALQDLLSGLEGMIRQPNGCFEQTSSSNYPNIMALQLMQSTGKVKPSVRQKALQHLDYGYKRLAGFETSKNGFEWFGRTPPHEGLTAYGLVQFHDMKKVYDGVDQALIDRTAKWLLSRRNGKGGWIQNPKYLHSWSSKEVADAYIVWAMSEAGYANELNTEIEVIGKKALKRESVYEMALVAMAEQHRNNHKMADALLEQIKDQLKRDLTNIKTEHSVVMSTGNGLYVESLSLAIMAELRSKNTDAAFIQKAMEKLLSFRQHGRFGNTQSTILALRAIIAVVNDSSDTKKGSGKVECLINGKVVASQTYTSNQYTPIEIKGLEQYLNSGKNTVEVRFGSKESVLPYSFDAEWYTDESANTAPCQIKMSTEFQKQRAKMGETVRLVTQIENTKNEASAPAMAKIGIPSGLSLQPWQLKELTEKEAFDFYEIRDNYLFLYYVSLPASHTQTINLDLKVEIPGNYRSPASSAYLYYTDEFKYWADSQRIQLLP